MSDRDTFVTSFLYDEKLVESLSEALLQITFMPVTKQARVNDTLRTVMYAGIISNSFAHLDAWVRDTLLPALPREHGFFQIIVLPERGEPRLFAFKDGKLCG